MGTLAKHFLLAGQDSKSSHHNGKKKSAFKDFSDYFLSIIKRSLEHSYSYSRMFCGIFKENKHAAWMRSVTQMNVERFPMGSTGRNTLLIWGALMLISFTWIFITTETTETRARASRLSSHTRKGWKNGLIMKNVSIAMIHMNTVKSLCQYCIKSKKM